MTDVGRNPGLATDAAGNPVIDPTKNVLDLVAAAIQRQDDLRKAEAKHQHEMAQLRADYGEKLRNAESARIDAIRKVDVDAVQRAAEVQAAQAQTLATQVVVSAEALRVSQVAALEPIQKSIDDLRRSQYESAGQKTQVIETQSKGASVGLWVGVGVAVFAVVTTVLMGLLGILVVLGANGKL